MRSARSRSLHLPLTYALAPRLAKFLSAFQQKAKNSISFEIEFFLLALVRNYFFSLQIKMTATAIAAVVIAAMEIAVAAITEKVRKGTTVKRG